MFQFDELRWYMFGLKVGIRNVLRNQFQMGLKKTSGKIFQPVNSYTRFPEYFFFHQLIRQYIREQSKTTTLKILDVGSPKLFGLYIAYKYNVELHLTDISRLNLDEYYLLWESIREKAVGKVFFHQQDGRNLACSGSKFDIIYSMSVIEHIQEEMHRPQSIANFLRILKSEGQLLLSIPLGSSYVEQWTSNFSYTADPIEKTRMVFFQRIYDPPSVRTYLYPEFAPYMTEIQMWTVCRRNIARYVHLLMSVCGENVMGLLGFLNPIWSFLLNNYKEGIYVDFRTSYTGVRSTRDVYGDLVIAGRKR